MSSGTCMRANTVFRNGLVRLLLIGLLALVQPAVIGLFGAEGDDLIDLPLTEELIKENLASFYRGKNHAVEGVKSRLQAVLQIRIAEIDRACQLTDLQKKKLELAGRGAIKQLIDAIEEKSRTMKWKEFRNGNRVIRFRRDEADVELLRWQLRSGPFSEDSFFAKSLFNVLTPEQAAIMRERPQRAAVSQKPITTTNAEDLVRISKLQKNVHRIVWSPDGKQVGLVVFDDRVDIHESFEAPPIRVIGEGRKVVDFDFSADAGVMAIGHNSESATIVNEKLSGENDLKTGESQPSVKFSPDGKWLATGGYGKVIKLWSVATGDLVKEFDVGPGEGGLTPVFSPDGAILAVSHRNSSTRLFDVSTGKLLHTLPNAMSQRVSFDPTGKTVAVAYVDGGFALWDVETGKNKGTIKADAGELYSIGWSPDGSLLVTSGSDAQVTLWNSADLSLVREIESPAWVIAACFSPDGTKLIFSGGSASNPSARWLETWGVP